MEILFLTCCSSDLVLRSETHSFKCLYSKESKKKRVAAYLVEGGDFVLACSRTCVGICGKLYSVVSYKTAGVAVLVAKSLQCHENSVTLKFVVK